MKNAVGVPSSVVLFGGTSDIGQETLLQLVSYGVNHVVCVSRDVERAALFDDKIRTKAPDVSIRHVVFDGSSSKDMEGLVADIAQHVGDIDVAIIAHAVLGDDIDGFATPSRVAEILDINMTATCALMYALAAQMKQQGHGRIALFSSVAGVRVRKANPVYGASKAGIDALALALDHELQGSNVSIVVIRPGYVHTKMTSHMKPAPFSTTADDVARKSVAAIRGNVKVIWVPTPLKYIFGVLRVLPISVWRRLPIHN